MPIIKSACKRVKTTRKATVRNNKYKRILKATIKSFQSDTKSKSSKIGESLRSAQSALDVAAKKGLMHKNKVARKKQQLAKLAKEAGAKSVKSTPKKPTIKKPSTKPTKTPIKKPTPKKSTKK